MFRNQRNKDKINLFKVGLFVFSAVVALWFVPSSLADGGDIDITLVASAPESYDHAVGGGAYNDGTNAEDGDFRRELQGSGLTCGDVVSYMALIEVSDRASAIDQVAELTFNFGAEPTGRAGFAHTEVVAAAINYGQVENGDNGTGVNPGVGGFGLDSAINDDRQTVAGGDTGIGGSQVSYATTFEPAGTTPFNGAEELMLTVTVDDLDPGETVVLRMDVSIHCLAGSSPTGNLQTQFDSGYVIAEDGQSITPDRINGGNQTINLKKLDEANGVNAPLLAITHTVMTVGGQCGIDDVKSLTINPGQEVTYCVTVTNMGTDTLFDVIAEDTTALESIIELDNLTDEDGEGDIGDLAANSTVTGQYNKVYDSAGNDSRIVSSRGTNGADGSSLVALSDNDIAGVIISAPTAIQLSSVGVAGGNNIQTTAVMLFILGALGLYLSVYAVRHNGGIFLAIQKRD